MFNCCGQGLDGFHNAVIMYYAKEFIERIQRGNIIKNPLMLDVRFKRC